MDKQAELNEFAEDVKSLSSREKAALVVVSLGSDRASQIYKYLSEQEIEELTYAVAGMGKADNKQVEDTLDEFYKFCLAHKMMTDGGMEYARDVLEKAFGSTAAAGLLDKVSRTLQSRPFSFFMKGDPKAVLSLLQNERSQVIALIISYMDPDQAAKILEQLPESKRIAALENVAGMDRVSPEAIAIVEEEMRRKFSAITTSTDNTNLGGVDYVADVMNNLDRTSEKNIFDGLSDRDQELADEISKRMFVFEDIITMDDRSVQRFVRDCDPRDLVLALKTANADVANKLFTNMSARMAESIRDDLEVTTNVRMKDVEDAQQRIVGVIRDLEERNEIIIMKGGKDDIIA